MLKKIQFEKYHGLGNDFILIDAINQRLDDLDLSKLAINFCDRNFGIGADGVVLLLESLESDLQMRIFNPDGSEAEMCGNAIRCIAEYAYTHKFIEKEVFSVETKAGVMLPGVILKDNVIQYVEVDMGEPILKAKDIPVALNQDKVIRQPIIIQEKEFSFTSVSMGNPHTIIFAQNLKDLDIHTLGPIIETHSLFPKKTNVEFVQVLNPDEIVVIVWERGAGETLACGTGACASVVAGVLNNLTNRKVLVHLPGGDLQIEWQESNNHLLMAGPAKHVYHGEIDYLVG